MEASPRDEALSFVQQSKVLQPADRAVLEAVVDQYWLEGVQELSFVSDEIQLSTLGPYTIEESSTKAVRVLNGGVVGPRLTGLAIDETQRFIASSNHIFHHPYMLARFHEQLLALPQATWSQPARRLGLSAIYAERWPPSFGHLLDEIFSVAAVLDTDSLAAIPLLNYPPLASRHGHELLNIALAAEAIFGGAAFNVGAVPDFSVEVERLLIIRNRIASTTFHRFPRSVGERMVNALLGTAPVGGRDGSRVYLARSESPDPARRIAEADDIRALAAEFGFAVVNPGQAMFPDLLAQLRNAEVLLCPWGGALTNAAFMPRGGRVIVIKPEAYRGERLDFIFGNLIDEHDLSVEVLTTEPADNLMERVEAALRLLDEDVDSRGPR